MKKALTLLVCATALIASPANANPDQVAPDGWQRSDNRGLTVFQSNPPGEVMVFRTFEAGSNTAEKVAVFTEIMTGNADRIVRSEASASGTLSVHDIEYVRRNITMQGKIIGVRQSDGQVLVMAYLAQKSAAGRAQRADAATQKMTALAGSGSSPTRTARPAPVPPSRATTPPPSGGRAAQRVMFELKYSYGVGGAVYPTYDLVALLPGGTAAKLGGYAPGNVDVAAIRRKKAADVGTWRNAGRNVRVRWSDGDTSDLKPSVGPPTPLPSARNLSGTYQAIGGDGNTALGGQVLTAQVKQFTFNSNGTFSQSSNKSASSGAGVGRSRSATSGRWQLDGATLTLTYGNGRVMRTSVYYSGSAKARGKFGRYGVLWIGGEDYKRVR
ncbi:MAG: lipocalin family protein [Pseudomonadota bacterium]